LRHYKSNKDNWEKNKRKKARICGEEYVRPKGSIVCAKQVVHCVCHHGRQKTFKCDEFTDDRRNLILHSFYSTGDYGRQRDFLINNTIRTSTTTGVRKHRRLAYFLPIDGVKRRVCQKVFLGTLNISERLVIYTLDEAELAGLNSGFAIADQRGRHRAHNKTSEELLHGVRQNINSFPRVDPHYTRADTNRQFLGSDLNITRLCVLYEEDCKQKGLQAVKKGVYRQVFCDEYNLSFHQPKKDACLKCQQYENATHEERSSLQDMFDQHIKRKDQARQAKNEDKARAATNNSDYLAVTADLQSVLITPCGNVSALYYSRKLSV